MFDDLIFLNVQLKFNSRNYSFLHFSYVLTQYSWSPPYHYYILQAVAFVEYPLPWIASIQYGYKVAPPSLIATTISMVGSVQYILGNYTSTPCIVVILYEMTHPLVILINRY